MRKSFQDGCSENVIAEPFGCSGCGKTHPAWALYEPEGNEDFPAWVCGRCIDDHAKGKEVEALPSDDPWQSERGKYLKAERNLALDYAITGWAIMPDSPLTQKCREAFLAYRAQLNRMTVDFTPDTWVWPARPEHAYA